MDDGRFQSELAYQVSLAIAESLLRLGLLTPDEFFRARALMLERYDPPIGTLCATFA
jgi:hypothetical protein